PGPHQLASQAPVQGRPNPLAAPGSPGRLTGITVDAMKAIVRLPRPQSTYEEHQMLVDRDSQKREVVAKVPELRDGLGFPLRSPLIDPELGVGQQIRIQDSVEREQHVRQPHALAKRGVEVMDATIAVTR